MNNDKLWELLNLTLATAFGFSAGLMWASPSHSLGEKMAITILMLALAGSNAASGIKFKRNVDIILAIGFIVMAIGLWATAWCG